MDAIPTFKLLWHFLIFYAILVNSQDPKVPATPVPVVSDSSKVASPPPVVPGSPAVASSPPPAPAVVKNKPDASSLITSAPLFTAAPAILFNWNQGHDEDQNLGMIVPLDPDQVKSDPNGNLTHLQPGGTALTANQSSTGNRTEIAQHADTTGTKLMQTPWLLFSEVIFRKRDKLPNEFLSLHNVKCSYSQWQRLSPVAVIAFPPSTTDSNRNTFETIVRHDNIQRFRFEPIGQSSQCNQSAQCRGVLYVEWQQILEGKISGIAQEEAQLQEDIIPGRAFEAAICYSAGNELLECDAGTSKCVCPKSGNLAKLRMTRIKASKTNPKAACFSMDCGFCLMKSKVTCGHHGVCREAAITRKWPFTHLNGSCRDSILNLNSQLAPHEIGDKGYSMQADGASCFMLILIILIVNAVYMN